VHFDAVFNRQKSRDSHWKSWARISRFNREKNLQNSVKIIQKITIRASVDGRIITRPLNTQLLTEIL